VEVFFPSFSLFFCTWLLYQKGEKEGKDNDVQRDLMKQKPLNWGPLGYTFQICNESR
jgi:hypothetical protein